MAVNETFFISHGSPILSIDDSLLARHFMKSFRDVVYSQKPKLILVISAHWETDHPTVNAVSGSSDTIYDSTKFSEQMHKLKYPAPGSPELAKRVKEVLTASGFEQVSVDNKQGLDHGAWVPLMLMYPEADIPVCQLSLQPDKNATYHYNLGKALAPLKEQGVLIIGSGSATHNFQIVHHSEDGSLAPWALGFDNWIKDALLSGRFMDVNDYEKKTPFGKMAHAEPEHLYPLHVAMEAAGENAKAQLIHSSWDHSTLSYASYKFTSTP